MAKKNIIESHISNKKRYNEYCKKSHSGTAVGVVLVAIREYGIFILPLIVAYLLFYYVVFENGGSEDGTQAMYIIIFIAILVVVAAAFFLRKLLRKARFERMTAMKVPVFKNNTWRCPLCSNENHLLSPCKVCGIFPELYKSDKEFLEQKKKSRSKKEQREFDEYKPQFKND